MATHSVTVPQEKILNVPAPLIRQRELLRFITLRNRIEKMQAKFTEMEDRLKDLLGKKVKVEEGAFMASLNFSERRNVSWKTEAIGLADELRGKGEGEKWAEAVIAETEPKPMIKLVVK
jgi:hypothetical protein